MSSIETGFFLAYGAILASLLLTRLIVCVCDTTRLSIARAWDEALPTDRLQVDWEARREVAARLDVLSDRARLCRNSSLFLFAALAMVGGIQVTWAAWQHPFQVGPPAAMFWGTFIAMFGPWSR